MPELLVEGVQGSEVAQTRVVHEHVEPAEALRDLLEQRSDAFTVADVELVGVPFDLLRNRGRGFGIAVDDRDDGTFVRERDGRGPSDTGATTGHDRDAALESVHATEATEHPCGRSAALLGEAPSARSGGSHEQVRSDQASALSDARAPFAYASASAASRGSYGTCAGDTASSTAIGSPWCMSGMASTVRSPAIMPFIG